jgi:endonuclease YncB( thermonuclease family)
MAEMIVWIAWTGDYDERCVADVFDNEAAAQRMVSDGLADDYDSVRVLHKSPTPLENWSVGYTYDLDDKILKRKEDTYMRRVAVREKVGASGWQSQYYQEPTPGNPQPAGSGYRFGRTLNISVYHAESLNHALRTARKFAESWPDKRGKMADG